MMDGISHREEIFDGAFVIVDLNDDIDHIVNRDLLSFLTGIMIFPFTDDRFGDPDTLAFCLANLNLEGNEILNLRIEIAESWIPDVDFF